MKKGINKKCQVCKEEFYAYPYEINKRRFCSVKCKHPGRRVRHGYIQLLRHDHPYADSQGYVMEHRLIMEDHLGRFLDKKEIVDHINRDTSDNRLENLRVCTQGQNLMNKIAKNKTGFKGVSKRLNGRFSAKLQLKGKPISLGTYDTLLEAAAAYDEGARQYFGEYACTNL